MKNVKKLTLLLLMCCISIYSIAQTSISGKVTSSADNSGLAGVNVSVKGVALGTATDVDGNFSITIPTNKAILIFNYLGFKEQQISVSGSTKNLKVEMSEDTQLLQAVEIVATGYGTARKSDLTGAISSISSEDIKKSMSTSVEQAMQGRIAGVQVTQNTGQPGGGISVSVRGTNSLNGNEPLYVVDGVVMPAATNNSMSALAAINPADIVSMDVLKDASATAIYGSRAANGVVMITTKQGETGKPRLSYDGYFGLQQLTKQLPTMNLQEWATYYNDRAAIQGWGIRTDYTDPSLLGTGTNWQKELFRTAPMQNHNINVSGGSGGTHYFLSGGFMNQDGIGLASNYRRFTFRSNINMEITKWLDVGISGSAANTKQINTMDASGAISSALNQRPDILARNADGSLGLVPNDQFKTFEPNPLVLVLMKENYNTGTPLTYNFYGNLKPVKGMVIRVEYNGYLSYGNSYSYTPLYTFGDGRPLGGQGENKGSSKSYGYTFKTYLTYDWALAEKNKFQIMAGHEANANNWENLSTHRSGYIFNSVHSLNVGDVTTLSGTTATVSDGMGSSALESYFGRFQYNFDDRYLLNATLRADGSSTFGANNRWGYFPSAALAWRVKNESFLKDVDAINNLKIRLEWGVSGNQGAGSYAYGVTMRGASTYWGTGFTPSNYGNADLKWERQEQYNIGMDLGLFKDRVQFTVDAYNKTNDNLVQRATLPNYIVYNSQSWACIQAPYVNVGAINNRGLEFSLNTTNIQNRNWNWKTGLTLTFTRNKLTKLYSDGSQLWGGPGSITLAEVGRPLGQIYAYKVIGMFTKEDDFYQKDANGNFLKDEDGNRIAVARPKDANKGIAYPISVDNTWVGDYIFQDLNGDGVIDEKDRTYLGNTYPKFNYGINSSLTWKNFEFDFSFYGVYGNTVYNQLRADHSGTGGYGGKLKSVADFARIALIDPNGSSTDISNVYVSNASTATAARVIVSGNNINGNDRASSLWVEDGSYLRLKNIALNYTVPKQWLQKILRIDYLQVYVNAQNLFTITKYTGYDPEVGSYDFKDNGIDQGRYPSARMYQFGLRFNF
jgi:TonB-linked SusC/RagA family outer membrane protein